MAVSCVLAALDVEDAAVVVVVVVDADVVEDAVDVADVAAVKVSGLIKKSPCGAAGTFLY
ncbi:hypothetical protein ACDZ29_05425 [Peribacillus sp. RS7]|uniref:hypothetical protein n=1 Tax=Peribacillus sp. RS7 TaxID=3242679 RepID=UPI0035C19ED9